MVRLLMVRYPEEIVYIEQEGSNAPKDIRPELLDDAVANKECAIRVLRANMDEAPNWVFSKLQSIIDGYSLLTKEERTNIFNELWDWCGSIVQQVRTQD